jgi:hypothetical protein
MTKAQQRGIDDARTFDREHPLLAGEVLGHGGATPDEDLVTSLGTSSVARLFGVRAGSRAFVTACRQYAASFLAELGRRAGDR